MQVRVALSAEAIPLLEGAAECSAAGLGSSLLPANMRNAAGAMDPARGGQLAAQWPLLCDPQTAGGLLAG
jgi:selenide,water dikinase